MAVGDLTTDELRALLARLGMRVSANQIRTDTYDRYLPAPRIQVVGGAGVVGMWAPWQVRRVVYLYRLRRRGARGDLLRLLLFLRDGSGFQQIQPVVIAGAEKLLRLALSPVRRHHRTKPTRAEAEFLVDEYETHVDPPDPGLDQFVWGTLLYGEPLSGGSFERIAELIRGMGLAYRENDVTKVKQVWADLGFTEDRFIAAAHDDDPARWKEAASCVRGYVWLLRCLFRSKKREANARDEFNWSTNLISGFGLPRHIVDSVLRQIPGRPTRAQLLGAFLVISLCVHEYIDDGTFARLGVDGRMTSDIQVARRLLASSGEERVTPMPANS